MFLVGLKSGNYSSTSAQSISLTDLTGPGGNANVVLEENDFVIVSVTHAGSATRTLAQLTPTGYTNINAAVQTASDTNVVSGSVFRKFMGSTPDTTATLPACAASTNSIAYSIEVWRGVDTTTPLAGVTPTVANAINTGLANPPSVTTAATIKGQVVVGAFGSSGDSTQPSAVFTNTGATTYDSATFTSAANTSATNRAVSGMGAKQNIAASTAFDAAITGNNSGNRNGWWACSFVLKPDVTNILTLNILTENFDDNSLDSTKWVTGMVGGYLDETANHPTVAETNQLLQIDTVANDAGGNVYGGIHTKKLWSLRGTSVAVHLTKIIDQDQTSLNFAFVADPRMADGASIEVYQASGVIKLEARFGTGGGAAVLVGSAVTYDPLVHNWLRLLYDDGTDRVWFQYATDDGTGNLPSSWSQLVANVAKPASFNPDAGYVQLSAGSWASKPSTRVQFDGVNTSAQLGNPALTVQAASSASAADNITLAPKTTLSMNPASSASTASPVVLGTTMVVANAISASTTGNITLASKHVLTVGAASSASTTDNVVLSSKYVLSIQNALTATVAGNITLGTSVPQIIASGAVSLTVTTSPTLAPKTILTMANAASLTTTTAITLSPKTVLTVANTVSASVTDNVVLASKYVLTPGAANSASTTTSPVLASKYVLTIADAASASQTTSPTLASKYTLTIQAATSVTTTTALVLTPKYALTVANALSASTVTSPVLVPRYALVVDSLVSTTLLDGVFFSFGIPTQIRVVSLGAQPRPSVSLYGQASARKVSIYGQAADRKVSLRGQAGDRVLSLRSSGVAGRTVTLYREE